MPSCIFGHYISENQEGKLSLNYHLLGTFCIRMCDCVVLVCSVLTPEKNTKNKAIFEGAVCSVLYQHRKKTPKAKGYWRVWWFEWENPTGNTFNNILHNNCVELDIFCFQFHGNIYFEENAIPEIITSSNHFYFEVFEGGKGSHFVLLRTIFSRKKTHQKQ